MPNEPLSVFPSRVDPDGVLDFFTTRFPNARTDRRGTGWVRLVAPLGPSGGTLTLIHDTDYYAEPGWADQLDGMRAYFGRFPYPYPAIRDAVLDLIGTFSFALAAQFDPDYDPDDDARLAALFDVAEYLDGVIVSPNALRDAAGLVLIDAAGWHDPDAGWPRVVATAARPDRPPPGHPPDARRIARRALVLAAVTARAVIDRDYASDPAEAAVRHGQLLRWLEILDIVDEFEPDEFDTVRRPPGLLEPEDVIDGVWRIEGLAMLAWSLGRYLLPAYDALVPTIDDVWAAVGFLDPGKSLALVRQATLRPAAQLAQARDMYFALHWRLQEFGLRPNRIDFARVSASAPFGPLAVHDLPLVDDELVVKGFRLDQAPAPVVGNALSVARERHKALNWLTLGPATYSDASENT